MPGTKKLCPECGAELWAMHLPGHRLREHGIEHVKAGTSGVPRETPALPAAVPAPDDLAPTPSVSDETPDEPAPRKPKFMDRLRRQSRRGRGGGGSHAHPAPVPGERAPKRKRPGGRRVSLDADISDIWGFVGRRAENTPHYPTGRMLQYQAPAAGVIIDRLVAGTLPDRLIFQPLARNRDKYEDTAFLLAGPFLTFSITTTMQRMQAAIEDGDKDEYDALTKKLEVQREMFTWTISMMLPRLAVGAKVAREKKAKENAAIAEAFPDLGDEDPVEAFAEMCFAPPPTWKEGQFNGEPDQDPAASGREGAVSL